MELSIFLAKLIGLYMLIFATLWLVKKDQMDIAIKDFVSSKGLILFAGAINIILGLAIAIGHHVFELNWRGLITLLAYVMIFQGIVRVAFIDQVQKIAPKIASKGFWPIVASLAVLGAFLTYCGFTY